MAAKKMKPIFLFTTLTLSLLCLFFWQKARTLANVRSELAAAQKIIAGHEETERATLECIRPEFGAFDDLRSALKARLKGLPRGL
jgi:hypothetical protein